MKVSGTWKMQKYFSALKREWRWLPLGSGLLMATCMAVAFLLVLFSGSRLLEPFLHILEKPFQNDIADQLLIAAMLVAALAVMYVATLLAVRQARSGRPATAILSLCIVTVWMLFLTASALRPVFITEIMMKIAIPRFVNLTPEMLWDSYENGDFDGEMEMYFKVCRTMVAGQMMADMPVKQCRDPGNPSERLSLEPQEETIEQIRVVDATREMNKISYRLMYIWIAGTVLFGLAVYFLVRRERRKGSFALYSRY